MSSKFKTSSSRWKQDPPEFDKPTSDQGNLARGSTDGPEYGLQLLYDGANPDRPDVDFVAVHRLGGHPLTTFTDAETGCCWLRDLLPLESPHCRVFSYGYRANSFRALSKEARCLCWELEVNSREQATTRRRIFICHSTGGLLVKRVLIENSQLLYKVDPSGIVFFGTPHRGSSSADLPLTLANILTVIPGLPVVDSSHVDEIDQAFARTAAESMSIGSFYETEPTKHFGIIERSSAILNYKSEVCISLAANHAQLCKFKNRDDDNYKKVSNLIGRFREMALLADDPLNGSLASLSASPTQEFLSQWIPCVASKKGTTSMGLLEMAGSMEQPNDYLDAEMDIIAVHGLRGGPVQSWSNRSPPTMWLRDMLQVDISNSRVMSYGYRSEHLLGRNKFDLDTLAKDLVDSIIDARAGFHNTARPLIFIGYSFGGLLVKKALLYLRENEQFSSMTRELMQAVISVIFLGVPHDIDDPSFAHRWTGIVQCTTGIKHIDILKAAESIDEVRQISTEFRSLGKLHVCSIAESEPTRVSRAQEKPVLVSAKSSRLGWEERETIFLAKGKGHLELPMFVDAGDPAYICIRDFVSRSLDRHGRDIGQRESELLLRALWQVDYERRFTSIQEPYPRTCQWIFDTEPTKNWFTKPRGILLVQGLTGSGKSVLAKHLVRQIPEALQSRATRILYYFVSFKTSEDTCENIMASFLHQLFKESGSSIKHAIKHFRTLGEEFVGSLDVLIGILSDVITQEGGISFIAIIDGFDQLNPGERRKLIKLSSQLEDIPNLGCIMTTRNTPDVVEFAERQYVTLSLWESRYDIENFVSESLEALLATFYHGLPSAKLQVVKDLVVEHATGSFLYAALAVKIMSGLVRKGAPLSEVVDSLNRFPFELNLLCDQLIDKIEEAGTPDDISEYRQILSILAVQRESMHLSVLAEALQEGSPQTLSPERIGDIDRDYVHHLEAKTCALSTLILNNDNYITLAHVSVREYLFDTERSEHSSLTPIDFNQANADMARRCVTAIYRALAIEAQTGDLEELGQGFTGYASRNWTSHFRSGKELVDEELIGLATALFRNEESPVSRWLTLYEEATAEKLPRRGIFGPFFGGSYFGLTPVVKKSLEAGCGIDVVDSDGKTPLHWACERGYADVVVLLIHNGANIFSQAFDGRTALHFAAQNNHLPLVKRLLAFGVSPDSAAFDGRTALHFAVETNNTELIGILLGAGADATERTTGGLNAFHLASQLTTQSVLQLLMSSTTVPEKLLSKAISENTPDMVALLMAHRLDLIESQYPWVAELVDEGLSSKEISSLLLQSENLQWINSEEWQPQPKRMWNELPALTHQRGCAHQLVHAVLGSLGPSSSRRIAEKQDEKSSSRGISSAHPSAGDSRVLLPDAFEELLEFFTRLEQREQKLLQNCGIGGVFPPWYTASNPGSAIFLAGQAKIMYGEPGSAQIFLPVLNAPQPNALRVEVPNRMQAGPSDDADADRFDVSSDLDSASIFSHLSETSAQTDSSYDSISRASNYEVWDQKVGRRILDALENILNALHFLHSDAGCCESFTILFKASSRHRTVMVKKISVSLLLDLCEALDQSTVASDTNSSNWTSPLARACTDFFDELECGAMVHKYLQNSLVNAVSPHRCLHLCALITQMAAIGIVTYSRGHSREFYTPTLSRSVDSFVLLGSEPAGPKLYAEQLELDCMGRMLGRTVWVFHHNEGIIGNIAEPYYLATSVGDMLDTWGGSLSLEDVVEPTRLFLSVGGGSIVTVESNDGGFDMAQDGELCCHWTPELGLSVYSRDLDRTDRRLLIGATSVNKKCLLEAEVCHEAFSGGALTSMGTRAPGWKTTGRAANLGIGFHGGSVGVAGTQTKDDGRSLKVKLLQDWDRTTDLRVLNRPCGLELSLCTGIARRLPLREFFYGEVLKYIELGLPGEWTKIQSIVTDIPGQSEKEFGNWLSKLTDSETKVMQKATVLLLLAMEYTGVERGGHTLTLWWPEKHEATPRSLQIKKEQYSGKNPWIPMFQDPEKCVIFGLATPRCLEHPGVKMCQKTTRPTRCEAVKEVMLDTSLIPATPLINAAPLSYELNKRYVLCHCRHILRVTRASEATDAVVRLKIVPGTPHIVIQRLIEKWEKVKEKETLGDNGQDVLIL